MLFITPPENANDIRSFCARFSENIRVEYKSAFDDNVRRNLPKVLSSFANSLGGVLIIGVEAPNGIPQEPIQGFENLAEELPLTIENICFQNINPPVVPRIRTIPSDIVGRSFAVIEIEESWEAPHALENSKKVYVRTGNSANPYELANVDLIIELVRRRAEPEAKRQRLLATARKRASNVLAEDPRVSYAEINISPQYPRYPLCTREECWNFFENNRYRGGHYFPFATIRRVEDGIASYNRAEGYGQISHDGVLLIRGLLPVNGNDPQHQSLLMGDLLHPVMKLLHCAEAFYRRVNYRGSLTIEVSVINVRLRRMLFLREGSSELAVREIDDFKCFEEAVSVVESLSTEQLGGDRRGVVQNVMRQMCWSFWQSADSFPSDALSRNLGEIFGRMEF